MIETPHRFQSLGIKGGLGRLIGRINGGMNTKLHSVTHANGRPLSVIITGGQVSDYTSAAALLDDLPKAQLMQAVSATRIFSRSGAASRADTAATQQFPFPLSLPPCFFPAVIS